jgi:hypothetical protein
MANGTSIICSNNKTPSNCSSYVFGLWLSQSNTISKYLVLRGSLLYSYQFINDFKNSVVFITNWDNGPVETDINLTTKIEQQSIAFPVSILVKIKRFNLGLGGGVRYNIYSSYGQSPTGKYSVGGYADGNESVFTPRVYRVYSVNKDTEALQMNLFNLFSSMILEYRISNKISLGFAGDYFWLKENKSNMKFQSYNSLNLQFLLIYKFKSYENS